jgi:hypothetical protein
MSTGLSLRELRERFRMHAIEPDALFLLNVENALDFIEEATAVAARLAGVEGFLVTTGGAFEPRQDFSNDIAGWRGSSRQFLDSTKALIERGASVGIRFQVVFEDEQSGMG